MPDSLDELISRADRIAGPPADSAAISRIERRFGLPIPEPVLRIWRLGSSIQWHDLDAELVGAELLCEWIDRGIWHEGFIQGGYLPLLDDHESNFATVMVRPPLAPRLAFVPHDDGPRLVYTSIETFARSMLDSLDRRELARDTLCSECDYPRDGRRTIDDRTSGRRLLETRGDNNEWNYAIQLLDEDDIDAWERLLETDHFVRREAIQRVKSLLSRAIHELLKRDKAEFDRFASEVVAMARHEGMRVGPREDSALQINDRWKNLETFFYRRKVSNALPRMIQWMKDQEEGRDPRKRRGHFFED
jgi:hypothetical protein